MPTGYTADLHDGKEQSFPEFVMGCAHAFGALVLLRDEGKDAPIPTFEPMTKYEDAAIERGLAKIHEASAWTPEQATAAAKADYRERQRSWREYEAKKEPIRQRYEAMVREVEAWTPPTEEHAPLKKFMLDQLAESIRFDATPTPFADAFGGGPLLTGEEYQSEIIRKSEADVQRARQRRVEEIERTKSRNAWVAALRESLPAQAENLTKGA